jgi:hypothetical protein
MLPSEWLVIVLIGFANIVAIFSSVGLIDCKEIGQKFVYSINQLQSSDWNQILVNTVITLHGWKPKL